MEVHVMTKEEMVKEFELAMQNKNEYVSNGILEKILRHRPYLLKITKMRTEQDERQCLICGCTQNNACIGGCYWVEENLCSKCAEMYCTNE